MKTTTDGTITVTDHGTTTGGTIRVEDCETVDNSEYYPGYIRDDWKDYSYDDSCMHMGCPECGGTGRKKAGGICVHMLSCPCPRCSPR